MCVAYQGTISAHAHLAISADACARARVGGDRQGLGALTQVRLAPQGDLIIDALDLYAKLVRTAYKELHSSQQEGACHTTRNKHRQVYVCWLEFVVISALLAACQGIGTAIEASIPFHSP